MMNLTGVGYLADDDTFVLGKTRAQARELLDAASALGYPSHVVRTVDQGFIVPSAVWDETAARQSAARPEF